MPLKVAINGFGRIGRNVLRALYESEREGEIKIVAVNDLAPLETNLHLLRFDSVHGPFGFDVEQTEAGFAINGDDIKVFSEREPAKLPWGELEVDVVFECTGLFTAKQKAAEHVKAGAGKVLISAPSPDADAMVVYGVNHKTLTADDIIVSNASCTTNCLAPLAKVLDDTVGIERGLMTTIHSYTNDQQVLDLAHKDMRRARAAGISMIPTSTGAAKAVGKVLPNLNGKLDGYSMRVPTPNVSVVDLTFTPKKATTVEQINNAIIEAVDSGVMHDALDCTDLPLVSCDFNHAHSSSIVDLLQTQVMQDGKLVKVISWYDNEWGFSNRMLDVAEYMGNLK